MTYHEPPSSDERVLAASERSRVIARGRQLRRRISCLALSVVAAAGLSGGILAAVGPGEQTSTVRVISPPPTARSHVPIASILGTLPPGRTTTTVPVVVCPTNLAYTPPTVPAATSVTLDLPVGLAGSVAVYTDTLAKIKVIGPKGWACSALYGQDGSGGVSVHPASETIPFDPSASIRHVPNSSKVEGLFAGTSGACVGCTLLQACPLFPEARQTYLAQNGYDGCAKLTKPAEEATGKVADGVVAFRDPPGTPGTARPSGGVYPAVGVMTYHPGSDAGSWTETCTLPAREADFCTLSLGQFVAYYGNL